MRILFLFVIIGFLCLCSNPAIAAEECSGEVNLTTKFQEALPTQAILELKSGLKWSWLTFDFDGRYTSSDNIITTTQVEDEGYSAITAVFGTPFVKNLAFKTTTRNEEKNWKFSRELTYDWLLFKRFKGKLSFEDGSRDADDNSYTWDKEALTLGLDLNLISYTLDYSRGYNNYSQAIDCTSLKETLTQKLFWNIKQDDMTLSYQETTGDFPKDLKYTKAYWKGKWELNYRHEFSKVWRCVFKYSQMHEDKGFNFDCTNKDYQSCKDSNIEFLFKPDETLEISIRADLIDVRKFPNTTVLPEGWEEDDSVDVDTLSHIERDITLGFRIDLERFLWELGFYSAISDYKEDEKDKMNAGCTVTLHYKMKSADIVLKLAPLGDTTQTSGSYQLKLQYKF